MHDHSLLTSIDQFATMQQKHIDCLVAGRLKDVFSWQQERQRIFMVLKNALENEARNGYDQYKDEKHIAVAIGKMKTVMLQEKKLTQLVIDQQKVMQEKKGAMRKGKTALKGYSVRNGREPEPVYLSHKT